MKKKVLLIATALVIVGILLSCYFIYKQYFSTKTYIEQITEIKFPSWTITEEEFDNGEFALVAKYTLAESSRESFILDNNLVDYSKNPIKLNLTEWLQSENQPNYIDTDLYSLEDCTKNNSWKILTNKKTGELWIELHYPDFGGDAPECDKVE